jgi:hypothetical protein
VIDLDHSIGGAPETKQPFCANPEWADLEMHSQNRAIRRPFSLTCRALLVTFRAGKLFPAALLCTSASALSDKAEGGFRLGLEIKIGIR